MEFNHEWDPADFAAAYAPELEADAELAELVKAAALRCTGAEYVEALAAARELAPRIEAAIARVKKLGGGRELDPVKDRVAFVRFDNAHRALLVLMDEYERHAAVVELPRRACEERAEVLGQLASRARWEADNPEAHAAEQAALDLARSERVAFVTMHPDDADRHVEDQRAAAADQVKRMEAERAAIVAKIEAERREAENEE